jgi:hypothetical protein
MAKWLPLTRAQANPLFTIFSLIGAEAPDRRHYLRNFLSLPTIEGRMVEPVGIEPTT